MRQSGQRTLGQQEVQKVATPVIASEAWQSMLASHGHRLARFARDDKKTVLYIEKGHAMIRMVIADDHASVRSGLKQIFALVPDFSVVGEVVNGCEVLGRIREAPFDLLLLDINMSGISGVELIHKVKAQLADLPILVISLHNDPYVAARMLKAGASGYITKDCEPDILMMAIRTVAAQGIYLAPDVAAKWFSMDPPGSPQFSSSAQSS